MADRHPLGRSCRDPLTLLTVALLMPYALARHTIACRAERRAPVDHPLNCRCKECRE